MQIIEAILFEPVGCLAEFPSEPFHEIAVRFFDRKGKPSKSASRSYWHLLNLMQARMEEIDRLDAAVIEALECGAVDNATLYEDVIPALTELHGMGVKLAIASSLSDTAIERFLEKHSLGELFSAVWTRDTAGGIKATPLARAMTAASLEPEHVMFLTDTAEGVAVAKSLGVQSILMMNDPDDAKRLALREPAGGVVSLHELPDFIRLVAAEHVRMAGLIS
jgi:phosphoglycolate phosphatase-like HAD superfamily hydrolase